MGYSTSKRLLDLPQYWWSCSFACHKTSPWLLMLHFLWNKLSSLFSCQIPLPWVFIFLSLVNSPGNLYPGSVLHNKRGWGDTRQGSMSRPLNLLASMAVTFPVPRHRLKWEVSGGIHDSKLASSGRSLLPWPGVNACEALIRNLFLTLEDIGQPAAKTRVAQQKLLRLSGQSCSWWYDSPWL